MTANAESKQRVAVVGSGMAGLVTAHLLSQDGRRRYSVKVFESVGRAQADVNMRRLASDR
jgi:2-polyprenyl-6-methoxyphenol hydroxylase-like FAD-dependent oxidoreductase